MERICIGVCIIVIKKIRTRNIHVSPELDEDSLINQRFPDHLGGNVNASKVNHANQLRGYQFSVNDRARKRYRRGLKGTNAPCF